MIRLAKSGYGVKWNQLAGTNYGGMSGLTVTKNNGVYTINGTSSEAGHYLDFVITCIANHKYLGIMTCKDYPNITGDTAGMQLYGENVVNGFITVTNIVKNGQTFMLTTVNNAGTAHFRFRSSANVTFNSTKVIPALIDLTDAFGAGYEPTVEEFQAMYPADYYPYTLSEWQYSKNGKVTAYPTPVIENGTTLLPIENHVVGILNSKLPAGYRRVEYIQSTGTQYIDTGFIPNQDTKVDLSIIVTEYNSGNGAIFGGRDTYSSRNYSIVLGGTGDTIFSGYNQQNDSTGVIMTLNTLHKIVKDKNKLYYDGSLISTYTYGSFTSPYTMWIFGVHQTATTAFLLKSKLYSCKIYNDNVIVRNFIPCIRASDNKAGLYDTVNSTFYSNAGTGEFLYGSYENTKITYNYLQRSLPVGYVELEYLESTGTQWIDTGVNGDSTSYITYKFQYTSLSTDYNRVFGSRKNTQSLLNMRSSTATGGSFFLEWGGGNYTGPSIDTNVHEVILDGPNNQYKFDGALKSSGFNILDNNTYNLYIFGTNNGGSNGSKRFYWYKHYKSGALIRNYIPCYRYSDGVEGLYDTVTKQLFTNQGTGRFIRGKEINSGNLLNLSKFVRGYPSNTGFDKATKRTFTQNTYIQGIASNNYYSPTVVSNINITEQTVTIYGKSGYGIAFVVELKPNCTYKLYCQRISAQSVSVMYYANDGTFLSITSLGSTNLESTFTTISDFAYAIIDFVPTDQTTATFSNIALHEIIS